MAMWREVLPVNLGGVELSDLFVKSEVVAIRDGNRSAALDDVVVEAPLAIYLGGERLVTLLCTPEKREALALGFLRTRGLLTSRDDLAGVRLHAGGGAVEVELKEGCAPAGAAGEIRSLQSSGDAAAFLPARAKLCVPPVSGDTLTLTAAKITSLMGQLQERAGIFKATGGAHSAALAGKRGLILSCEDVGRHNAVDKVIGEALLQGIPLDDKALLLSCRLSSGILLKAAGLALPLLISRAAPTALAVELADKQNITLVGFVRGRRMNIYTHPRRIGD